MTSRILSVLLAVAGSPATALAHSGHIADQGQGHDHRLVTLLLALVVLGLARWAWSAAMSRTAAKGRR